MLERLKKIFKIDYFDLGPEDKAYIHKKFIDENYARLQWISLLVGISEFVLLLLDFLNGFFQKSPYNYLNLLAEIIIISGSLFTYFRVKYHDEEKKGLYAIKDFILALYKLHIALAVIIFIFTDAFVRNKILGPYIVFLFIYEIIPFFKARYNAIIFGGVLATEITTYATCAKNFKTNSLFGVVMITVATYIVTEVIRAILIKKQINNSRNYEMTKRFRLLAYQTTVALSNAVEAKDPYTKGHSKRVAEYSKEIARRMGYSKDRQNEVYYIGLLHDIGKIGVLQEVLTSTSKLTDEEFAEIEEHPYKGYEILKSITEISDIGMGARWHHERWDGSGYPDGLKGEEIPVIARIIAVADAYDAMTSNRSYRSLLAQDIVRGEITRNKGKQFCPEIADIMLKMIDEDKGYTMHE